MNWSVELVPALKRTSLILIGRTFRTLWVVVSDCVLRVAGSVHSALPVRKPAPVAAGEVTLKVALTLAPGATGSANVFDVPVAPETTAVHPAGMERLNLTPVAGAPVVFVNVCGDILRRARRERRDARQAHPLHVVPGGHDVGLHRVRWRLRSDIRSSSHLHRRCRPNRCRCRRRCPSGRRPSCASGNSGCSRASRGELRCRRWSGRPAARCRRGDPTCCRRRR